MYPEYVTAPMRAELSENGFTELRTGAEAEKALGETKGSALLVVNSVCGCAAAGARPGVLMALQNAAKPDKLYTVFAGVDTEATQKAREFLLPYPPSSPAVALFVDGRLVHILERLHIEGRSPQMIAENLKMAFNHFCVPETANV